MRAQERSCINPPFEALNNPLGVEHGILSTSHFILCKMDILKYLGLVFIYFLFCLF